MLPKPVTQNYPHMLRQLIANEIFQQNRIYQLSKFLLLFFSFGAICLGFINPVDKVAELLPIFLMISIPLSVLHVTGYVFREDVASGRFDILMTAYTSWQIVIGKYVSLCIQYFLVFTLIIPSIGLIITANIADLALLTGLSTLLMLQSIALCVLLGAIQSYFVSSSNYLAVLLLPSIIPTIIIAGLIYAGNLAITNISILFGINLVTSPLCLYLSGYLMANLYNF